MSESALSQCYTMNQLLKRLVEIGNGYRGKDANCTARVYRGFLEMRDGDVLQLYKLQDERGDLSAFGIQYDDYYHIHAVVDGVARMQEDYFDDLYS